MGSVFSGKIGREFDATHRVNSAQILFKLWLQLSFYYEHFVSWGLLEIIGWSHSNYRDVIWGENERKGVARNGVMRRRSGVEVQEWGICKSWRKTRVVSFVPWFSIESRRLISVTTVILLLSFYQRNYEGTDYCVANMVPLSTPQQSRPAVKLFAAFVREIHDFKPLE